MSGRSCPVSPGSCLPPRGLTLSGGNSPSDRGRDAFAPVADHVAVPDVDGHVVDRQVTWPVENQIARVRIAALDASRYLGPGIALAVVGEPVRRASNTCRDRGAVLEFGKDAAAGCSPKKGRLVLLAEERGCLEHPLAASRARASYLRKETYEQDDATPAGAR